MKALLLSLLLLCSIAMSALAGFVHPGLYHGADELAFTSAKVGSGAEPWLGAWKALKAEAPLDRAPRPVADWDTNAEANMNDDAIAAYNHALQWAIGGEQVHADKAISLLNAWSSTLKKIHGKNYQERLVCAWNACHLANAAELLTTYVRPDGSRANWAPAEHARLVALLRHMASLMRDYKPDFNGNWDAAIMNSLLCIAVHTDDSALFDSVLDHFHGKYPFDFPGKRNNGHFTAYILPSGQCQESGRDQGHVQLGLGHYAALCEVAWKQGVDLYGTESNRLAKAIEYAAKYNLGHDDLPFERTPPDSWTKLGSEKRGRLLPFWEAAYQHYVHRRGLKMPYTAQLLRSRVVTQEYRNAPGPYRPEGAFPLSGICWGTLTHFRTE